MSVTKPARSWRPEVLVVGEDQWHSNALRFATEREAADNACDLYHRWTSTTGHRAAPSDDPPNYRWVDGRLVAISPGDRDMNEHVPEPLRSILNGITRAHQGAREELSDTIALLDRLSTKPEPTMPPALTNDQVINARTEANRLSEQCTAFLTLNAMSDAGWFREYHCDQALAALTRLAADCGYRLVPLTPAERTALNTERSEVANDAHHPCA